VLESRVGVVLGDVSVGVGQARELAAIVAGSDDAILSKGLDGTIQSWNPGAERLYGFTAAEAIGRHITIVVPEDRYGEVEEILRRMRAGDRLDHHETVRRRKDGTLVQVSVTVSPVHDDDGRVVAASVIARDVTQRFEMEVALFESERHRRAILSTMLRAEEEERSRIATALHDDTVQVMTASLMAMDRVALVARRAGDYQVESAVAYARATLQEATDRTRRLMFELRPAILYDRGLAAALRVLLDQTAREIGAQAEVRGDIGRYDHALEELLFRSAQEALANVRRHAQPRRITLTLEDDNDMLSVGIHDDGRGFDLAGVRSRPAAALHLGLETLVERVRASGGHAEIASTPGSGTHVRIAAPTTGPAAEPRANSPLPGSNHLSADSPPDSLPPDAGSATYT
jgi:PAS domain S-box-containing protein